MVRIKYSHCNDDDLMQREINDEYEAPKTHQVDKLSITLRQAQ